MSPIIDRQVDLGRVVEHIPTLLSSLHNVEMSEGAAACLAAYFVLACPRPLNPDELASLMTEGTKSLALMVAEVIESPETRAARPAQMES